MQNILKKFLLIYSKIYVRSVRSKILNVAKGLSEKMSNFKITKLQILFTFIMQHNIVNYKYIRII